MSYKRALVYLAVTLMLCGCRIDGGDGAASVNLAVSNNGDGEAAVNPVISGNGDVAAVYAYSDRTVIDMENGEIILRTGDPRSMVVGNIKQAAGSEDMLFVLQGHTLTAMDRSGKSHGDESDSPVFTTQDIDTIEDYIYSSDLGYYQEKLHFLYTTHDQEKWILNAYCYEKQADGSFLKLQDTLCETIMELDEQGYEFCGDEQDLFTCLNEWDLLLVWKREEAKVSAFGADGTLCWERSIDPKIVAIDGTDGRFLIARSDVNRLQSKYEWQYYIYDFAGTYADGEAMWQGSREEGFGTCVGMLELRDGYVYYLRSEEWAYDHYTYSFFRRRLNPVGEEEFLFETTDVPGLDPFHTIYGSFMVNYMVNYRNGFFVWEDSCYFINFDDGSLWWYSCDLADEAHTLTRLGLVREYPGLFDMGEVAYQSGGYTCPDCGEVIGEYYAEQIRLSEEEVPYAEVINPILMEKTEFDMEEEWRSYAETTDCKNHTGTNTYEWYAGGVTQFTFSRTGQEEELVYLEAYYSGNYYFAGGRPQQLYGAYYFDLADGSETYIEDILGVSEEEFRTLVAEYTVAECRERNDHGFDADDDDLWNALYDDIYEYASFEQFGRADYYYHMYFGGEGLVVSYASFDFEPFETAFLETTIPYEDLGLELVDIYGTKMSW